MPAVRWQLQFQQQHDCGSELPCEQHLSSTGNAFASFLLGQVDSADRIGTMERTTSQSRFLDLYSGRHQVESEADFQHRRAMGHHGAVHRNRQQHRVLRLQDSGPGSGRACWARRPNSATARAAPAWIEPRSSGTTSVPRRIFVPVEQQDRAAGRLLMNFLDGGAYEYGTSKVAVNYGNLLDGSTTYKTTGSARLRRSVRGIPIYSRYPRRPRSIRGLGTASAINAFDPNHDGVAPYDIVWSVGIQSELPGNMLLSINYTGNRGNRLPSQLNPINQIESAVSLAWTGSGRPGDFAPSDRGGHQGPLFRLSYSNSAAPLRYCRLCCPIRSTPASSTTLMTTDLPCTTRCRCR